MAIKITRNMFSGGNLGKLENILLGLAADHAILLYAQCADPESLTVPLAPGLYRAQFSSTVNLKKEIFRDPDGADPNSMLLRLGAIRQGVEVLASRVNRLNELVPFGGVEAVEELETEATIQPLQPVAKAEKGAEYVRTRRAIEEARDNIVLVGMAVNRALMAFGQSPVDLAHPPRAKNYLMWEQVVVEAGEDQSGMPESLAMESTETVLNNLILLAQEWNRVFGLRREVKSISWPGQTNDWRDPYGLPRVDPPPPPLDNDEGLMLSWEDWKSLMRHINDAINAVGGVASQRVEDMGLSPWPGAISPESENLIVREFVLPEPGANKARVPLPVVKEWDRIGQTIHNLTLYINQGLVLSDQRTVAPAERLQWPGNVPEEYAVPHDYAKTWAKLIKCQLSVLGMSALRIGAQKAKNEGAISVVAAAPPPSS